MDCDIAVLVGRFQPLHDAHLELLTRALTIAPRCVVIVGSAFQARTPRNPFTWKERAEMIRQALPAADRGRITIVPMRDYYDETRWVASVREAVAAQIPPEQAPRVALVGHLKDATSSYLAAFPDAALAAFVDQVPPSTVAFLRAWTAMPFHAELAAEWRALNRYREAWRAAPYAPTFVTVDAIVQCAGRVLLIRRGKAPGRGLFAVPGGFIEPRETCWQSCLRELEEETHLKLLDATMRRSLRAVAVFDHPDRSQRGRTITHAHHFDLGDRELPEVRADDDAASVQWVPIDDIAAMEDRFFDDHFHMLDHFLGITGRG